MDDNEDGTPKKNRRFAELAIEVWEERAHRLWTEGRLDHPLHLDAFRNYCIETGRVRSFDEYLAEDGDVVEFKTGYSQQAPEVAMRKQAAEAALKWWKELMRVRSVRVGSEEDEASDLMD